MKDMNNQMYETVVGNEKESPPISPSVSDNNKKNSTRIIEIPVQHLKPSNLVSSPSKNTSTQMPNQSKYFIRESSPFTQSQLLHNHHPSLFGDNVQQDINTGFPTRSIFDRFDTGFDSPLSRRLDSSRDRDRGDMDHRFPLLSRFTGLNNDDDFFRPHLKQQQQYSQPDSFFNRNNMPQSDETISQPYQQQQQIPRQESRSNSQSRLFPNNLKESEPLSRDQQQQQQQQRNDSPKRYISHTYIPPTQPQSNIIYNNNNNQSNGAKAVPIKIHHISTSPQKSDFTVIDSSVPETNKTGIYKVIDNKNKEQTKESSPIASSSSYATPSATANNYNNSYRWQNNNSTAPVEKSDFLTKPIPAQTSVPIPAPAPTQNTIPIPAPASNQNTIPIPAPPPTPTQNTIPLPGPDSPPQPAKEPPPTSASQTQQPMAPASSQVDQSIKESKDRCQFVADELARLEKEVESFNGKKSDKSYLKLEELLTRCLLKLDEIERVDETVKQLRKSLINETHKLSDRLELIATVNEEQQKKEHNQNRINESGNNEEQQKKDQNQNQNQISESVNNEEQQRKDQKMDSMSENRNNDNKQPSKSPEKSLGYTIGRVAAMAKKLDANANKVNESNTPDTLTKTTTNENSNLKNEIS